MVLDCQLVRDLSDRIKELVVEANKKVKYSILLTDPFPLLGLNSVDFGFSYAVAECQGDRSDSQFMAMMYPFPRSLLSNSYYVEPLQGLQLDEPVFELVHLEGLIFTNDVQKVYDEAQRCIYKALEIPKEL